MVKTKPAGSEMLMNWPERVWVYSPVRWIFLRRHARFWQKLAGRIPARRCLEIGCGLGKGATILVDLMESRYVAAGDYEEILVNRAHRFYHRSYQDRIDFLVFDAQDLPFPDDSFDAVVNYGIIHHILDWRRSIREITRVLEPGGMFYFEEIYPALYANFLLKRVLQHPREDRFGPEEFLAELGLNGLKVLPGVDIAAKYAIVGAARKE